MADRLTVRGAQRWADEVLADTAEEPAKWGGKDVGREVMGKLMIPIAFFILCMNLPQANLPHSKAIFVR